MEFIYLSQEDVIAAGGLDMASCFEAIEKCFRYHATGESILPHKMAMRWGDLHSEETEGRINAMPGYLGGDVNLAGIKWIGSMPSNRSRHGLPRASGILILNDRETKIPVAIMDATIISAMRTGASGGVAAKYLARPDSQVCGIIGAGVQGRTQAMAVKVGLPQLKKFVVYDIDRQRLSDWCRDMEKQLGLPCEPRPSVEAAVSESDLFVTVTTANTPFIKKGFIRAGHTEIHMSHHEDEFDVLKKADKIVVDDWEQVKHRMGQTISLAYGKGLITDADIYADLGQIVAGQKKGRQSPEEFIYFNAVGMGIEDIAFAKKLLETAKKNGIGQRLSLWKNPIWV
jgi:ornithine cyclodeaminase